MKRFLATILALCASIAFGATTVPVQLLNPTGSTSGQTIVSTGPTTAPAWSGINPSGISAIGANTVLGNSTASSASPTAITVTGCNGAAQALQWTNGTGFGCNSNVATSGANANITSLSSGTTLNTPVITGVTSGGAAGAGQVGQLLTATASTVSISNSALTNCTSLTLTAGDWNVWGNVHLNPGTSTSLTIGIGGLNTTSTTLPASPNYSQWAYAGTTNFGQSVALPMQIFNVSGSTTVYAVVEAGFASGSANMDCVVNARRVH